MGGIDCGPVEGNALVGKEGGDVNWPDEIGVGGGVGGTTAGIGGGVAMGGGAGGAATGTGGGDCEIVCVGGIAGGG